MKKRGKKQVGIVSKPFHSKKIMNKKAISVWVSWILLVGFIIALSAFMFNWITEFTESKSEELKQRTYDTTECASISINLDFVCQSLVDTQILYINVTNTNNVVVNKIIFRFFDLHDINIEVKEKEFKLRPGKSEQLKLLKQGTLKRVEVIPVTFKEDFEIVCREKMAFTDIINEC